MWEQFGKRRWYAFTRMQTQVARRLPRVMTVSESSKKDIHRDHRVPLDRLHVVPVGVDPELFRPMPAVERIPGRLVTTASADVAMKGLRFLLEAIAKLRTERHIELTIIGKPNPESAASRTMTELGLDQVVSFVSGVSDQRIVELYIRPATLFRTGQAKQGRPDRGCLDWRVQGGLSCPASGPSRCLDRRQGIAISPAKVSPLIQTQDPDADLGPYQRFFPMESLYPWS